MCQAQLATPEAGCGDGQTGAIVAGWRHPARPAAGRDARCRRARGGADRGVGGAPGGGGGARQGVAQGHLRRVGSEVEAAELRRVAGEARELAAALGSGSVVPTWSPPARLRRGGWQPPPNCTFTEVTDDAERDGCWELLVAAYPNFVIQGELTDRRLQVALPRPEEPDRRPRIRLGRPANPGKPWRADGVGAQWSVSPRRVRVGNDR